MLAMIESKLTSKGQTTIPLPVRRALGISPGAHIAYNIEADGSVMIEAARNDKDQTTPGRLARMDLANRDPDFQRQVQDQIKALNAIDQDDPDVQSWLDGVEDTWSDLD